MKNLVLAATVILTLTIAGTASADIVILNRYDYVNDKMAQTVAMITPKVDFWGSNINNPKKADYEVGKELQICPSLKAGGNVAIFPSKHELDLVPSLVFQTKVGIGNLTIHGGIYIPLNGRVTTIFSRESSLIYKVRQNLEVGLAMTYSHTENRPEVFQTGLIVKVMQSNASLKLRWLMPNHAAPTKIRIETCCTF